MHFRQINVILLLNLYICCGGVINAYEWVLNVIRAFQQTPGHSTQRSVHFTARKLAVSECNAGCNDASQTCQ